MNGPHQTIITKMREKIYILNANFVVDIKKTIKKLKNIYNIKMN